MQIQIRLKQYGMTIELIDGLVFEAGRKTNAIHSGQRSISAVPQTLFI